MIFRVEVLGDFQLVGPDGAIDLESRKVRALLVYLTCTGKPQPRSTLATLLWGSHFDAQARQNLRQALTKARRLLGDKALVTEGENVAIQAGVVRSDAEEFGALCEMDTIEASARAVQLYKGQFAKDITITEDGWTEWVEDVRARYDRCLVDAILRLGVYEFAQDRPAQALNWAQRAVGVDRLREDCQRLLIRSFAALGRRTDALQHYERFAQLLQQELSVEPDPETKFLAQELRDQTPLVRQRHYVVGAFAPTMTTDSLPATGHQLRAPTVSTPHAINVARASPLSAW